MKNEQIVKYPGSLHNQEPFGVLKPPSQRLYHKDGRRIKLCRGTRTQRLCID